jgi:hypothetical protein
MTHILAMQTLSSTTEPSLPTDSTSSGSGCTCSTSSWSAC